MGPTDNNPLVNMMVLGDELKMTLYQYRKPHCWDSMILKPYYLQNDVVYTDNIFS